MLARHAAGRGKSDREIQQFRCLSTSDDMLKWWRQQTSTFPKLAALARSVLAVPATSAPSERVFFRLLALSSTQREHHWPLQGLTKLYLFMKMIVLLQHLKTTKLGYSCILYPCLCWCVELELVGCRLNLWWGQTCCRMDYKITIL